MGSGGGGFGGDTSARVLQGVRDGARVTPIRLNPDLPVKLEDLINKSLEKDRNLRYQHAADIRADLQRLKRDTESGRAFAASSDRVSVTQETSGPIPQRSTSSSTSRIPMQAPPA